MTLPGHVIPAFRRLGTRVLPPGIRVALAVAWMAGCGDAGAGPSKPPEVDLDALFAPATAAEVQAVRSEWAARKPTADSVRVEATQAVVLGSTPATLRVFSHALAEGGRHYGAVITANSAPPKSLPALVYAHSGDGGASSDELTLLTVALGNVSAGFVWVVPSFRSETFRSGSGSWRSGGEASPWDWDVDDAMAFLSAALATTPAADPERVGVIGFSRGGGVALLMGIRDRRVDRVVDFFGPTDFLGAFTRGAVEEALAGRLGDLPGLGVLDQRWIQPLAAGQVTLAAARRELVRRSAVLFAADLPPVQIHHGTADALVGVSQAESLIKVLEGLGRGPPADGYFLYPAGGHDPFTLPGSVGRMLTFLGLL